MGDLTRMKDYLASKRSEASSRHPAGKAIGKSFQDAIEIVKNEQSLMRKVNGATRGREREYDRGYETALNDIVILLNENVSGSG